MFIVDHSNINKRTTNLHMVTENNTTKLLMRPFGLYTY